MRAGLGSLGITSVLVTVNLGSMFLIIFYTVLGLLLSYLMLPFVKCFGFLKKQKDKLDTKFKWNWTIRVILEGAMDLSFACFLTYRFIRPGDFLSNFNLAFAYVLGVATIVFPGFLLIFYCRNFKRMRDPDDEEFHETYGAPYEGLKIDQRSSIFYPFWLIVRRILFMIVVFFENQYVTLQLLSMQAGNFVAFIYVAISLPYDDPFLNKMELFNEAVNIVCINLLFCFTDLIPLGNHH